MHQAKIERVRKNAPQLKSVVSAEAFENLIEMAFERFGGPFNEDGNNAISIATKHMISGQLQNMMLVCIDDSMEIRKEPSLPDTSSPWQPS